MSAIIKKNVVYANSGGSSSGDAKDIKYDNANSDLESNNIQDAIDEINGIELTQEQYDTLTEEEKLSGTYWIIDSGNENSGRRVEIVDNLESTDIDKALSANMGRELDEKFSPKQFEYTYSTDIQTDVQNCIEKVIELYGTDIALSAFWLSKTSEGINAYAGSITLVSNLSKAAIRIEGTYICSVRNIVITFQYNANNKTFIAFNDLEEKNNFGTRVDISSYTTLENAFVCPSDGYVSIAQWMANATSSNIILLQVYGSTTDGNTGAVNLRIWNYLDIQSLFVKKGMRCVLATNSSTNISATFLPLE